MKLHSNKLLLILFLLIGIRYLISCDPELRFEAAQPESGKNRSSFKKKYLGNYVGLTDSSILSISSTTIKQEWQYDGKIAKTDVDTMKDVQLVNGYILGLTEGDSIPYTVVGDSISYQWRPKETLFSISEHQVLRHYKGMYFLNSKIDDYWVVKLLKFNKGILELTNIEGGKEEIAKVRELAKNAMKIGEGGDTTYVFNPTRKELSAIITSEVVSKASLFRKR
ncbi:MAG: hypothetical protein RIC15_03610 [Vicingaceae bacterium]